MDAVQMDHPAQTQQTSIPTSPRNKQLTDQNHRVSQVSSRALSSNIKGQFERFAIGSIVLLTILFALLFLVMTII